MAASPALAELIKAVGEKDADRLYNAVILEYTQHVRKHLSAAKVEAPEKASEAEFVEGVLAKLEADPDRKLTEVLAEDVRVRR